MHRVFQRDLCKLRLSTARAYVKVRAPNMYVDFSHAWLNMERAYVKVLTDGQGPLSYTAGSSLRLAPAVSGLGPVFKLKIGIQVRFQIIRNARIENVGKYQSCMVSKLRIIWKRTRSTL